MKKKNPRVQDERGQAGTIVEFPDREPPEGKVFVWFDYQASKQHAKPVDQAELKLLPT